MHRGSVGPRTADRLWIRHALPGRLRLQLPRLTRDVFDRVERALSQVQGVRTVRGNTLTASVLILYDPTATEQQSLLEALHSVRFDPPPSRLIPAGRGQQGSPAGPS